MESCFEIPKRHARSSKIQLPQQNDYIHENRFNPLLPFDDIFNDETNDATDDSNAQQKNFENVTTRKNLPYYMKTMGHVINTNWKFSC